MQTSEGMLFLKSNIDWQVGASDRNPATNEHMTEWNGSEYGEKKLIHPLVVAADREVVLPDGGILQTGSKTAGLRIPFVLKQNVSWLDEPFVEGHTYKIDVTFHVVPAI